MSGNESLRIDAEHPWPWLDAFPESAQAFFNGREAATAQLLRCVLAAPATVLFGKSGLGKTSLLQAGLFPLLRAPERRLLPVLVRLDHGVDRPGLSAQLLARLRAETQAHRIAWEHPALPDEETLGDTARLWELLHDSRTQWRDAEGRRWTPVFVLDQFEEVFTLVAEVEAQQRLFDELGNLVQGRIPAEVAARLDAHDELLDRIDPERLGARFVLSLREDYLPDLEIHADRIPRLGPNRYRLLPMSKDEALEAIDKTGGALVQPRSPPQRPALRQSGAAPCGAGPGDPGGAGCAVRPSPSGEPETLVGQDTRLVADRCRHAQSRAGMCGRDCRCRSRRNKRSRGMTHAATTLTCSGVLEVVEDHQGDTYRAVYTVRFASAVYVLHCFQKKSVSGIATPKPDLVLIEARLKAVMSAEKDAKR